MKLRCRRVLGAALLAPLLVAAAPGRAQAPETPFAQVFSQLAGRLVGVVVNISTMQTPPKDAGPVEPPAAGTSLDDFLHRFFGDKGSPSTPAVPVASLGSGFVIDPSGIVVTNDHVIANAEQITVTLADNTTLKAKILGRDALSDLALLKIEPQSPLPAAIWGDSSRAKVGDWVIAIGNPFGLGGTVTAGIISAIGRDIHSGPYDFLQTDASINRGNSGGPMFDLDGEVIGINTAILSPSGGSIGIGFAIPSSFARPIIAQLLATGKVVRGWIGARIQPLTDAIAEAIGLGASRGAMIASVDPDSPAAQAKLQPGDVILAYEGTPIERSRDLPRLVAQTAPDKLVRLTIFRDGKQHEVTLKIAELNPNRPPPAAAPPERPKPPPSLDALGLKLSQLTPDLAKQYAIPGAAKGVVIIEVPANGPAEAQGLQPGDLVLAIGRDPVATPQEVQKRAAAAGKAGRKEVLVRVERGGTARFVALPATGG